MSIVFFAQVVTLPVLPDVRIEWSAALSRNRLSTVYCNLNLELVCVFGREIAPPCTFLNRKLSFELAIVIFKKHFQVQCIKFGFIYDGFFN